MRLSLSPSLLYEGEGGLGGSDAHEPIYMSVYNYIYSLLRAQPPSSGKLECTNFFTLPLFACNDIVIGGLILRRMVYYTVTAECEIEKWLSPLHAWVKWHTYKPMLIIYLYTHTQSQAYSRPFSCMMYFVCFFFQWKSRWCVMRKLSPVAGELKLKEKTFVSEVLEVRIKKIEPLRLEYIKKRL